MRGIVAQALAYRLDRESAGYTPMTVRVETFDARVGSHSWLSPALVRFTATTTSRLLEWWQRRSSTLVMSEEWLHEFRSSRDRD